MGTAKNTKTDTNVLEILTAQHKEVDALIAKIEGGKGDAVAAFSELADKLAAHAACEEKVFYPSVITKQTDDELHEAVEEHLQIKRVLADMLALDQKSPEFKAKLSVLKEDLSHHAHEEEEGELFPELRKKLSDDELSAIGNDYIAQFEDMLAQHPAHNVPAETDRAAPLPKV